MTARFSHSQCSLIRFNDQLKMIFNSMNLTNVNWAENFLITPRMIKNMWINLVLNNRLIYLLCELCFKEIKVFCKKECILVALSSHVRDEAAKIH